MGPLFGQLAHSIELNDVCDALQLQRGALRAFEPPSPNGLSHANKVRPAEMGEKLFGGVLDMSVGSRGSSFAGRRSTLRNRGAAQNFRPAFFDL